MSATDRTRGCPGPAPPQTDHNDAPHPGCPECGWEIEVLYELADAARDCFAGGPLDEWEHAYERVRAALARLDGEASP